MKINLKFRYNLFAFTYAVLASTPFLARIVEAIGLIPRETGHILGLMSFLLLNALTFPGGPLLISSFNDLFFGMSLHVISILQAILLFYDVKLVVIFQVAICVLVMLIH